MKLVAIFTLYIYKLSLFSLSLFSLSFSFFLAAECNLVNDMLIASPFLYFNASLVAL